jgi:hypothetical protein
MTSPTKVRHRRWGRLRVTISYGYPDRHGIGVGLTVPKRLPVYVTRCELTWRPA